MYKNIGFVGKVGFMTKKNLFIGNDVYQGYFIYIP